MSRATILLLGSMLSAIVLLLWFANHPPPARVPSPIASSTVIEASHPPTVMPPPIPAPVALSETVPSTDAQLALVLNQLQAWDDSDDSDSRSQRLQELSALLRGTNVFDLLQQLPPKFLGYAFAVPSVREQLMTDPAATLAWMSAHTNVSSSQLSTFLQDWTQNNHDGMSDYLATLPSGPWKQTVMAAAAGQASDPVDSILFARQMDASPQQTMLLQLATTAWARQNPDAASQWLAQIEDPDLREQLMGSFAAGYADSDPVQALQFSHQSLPPGPASDQSTADIAWRWALQDPASAGNYLTQLPEGAARQQALANVVNVWANHDPTAAMNWIENLPPGSLQAQAAAAMLATLPAGSQ
jgi:hypothetical protein